MPNYKNIQVLVEYINKNAVGLTQEKVKATTKLQLLRNGIKSTSTTNPLLSIIVGVLDIKVDNRIVGQAYNLNISLCKFDFEADTYYHDGKPAQEIIFLGKTYKDFEEMFKEKLDQFLVDYLESNME